MFDSEIKKELSTLFSEIKFDEPMSRHTTFKVGGPSDGFLKAGIREAVLAAEFCVKNNISYTIIGNGSNLLVSDKGIDGLVICVDSNMNGARAEGTRIYAEAGLRLSRLSELAASESLGGLEFAGGIPGNVGGAVYMNAGAYGGEIKDVLSEVTFWESGEILTKSAEELGLGYRESYFMHNDCIILSCVFNCIPRPENEIRADMAEFIRRRKEKQPLEYPSGGSYFKRPVGNFAGKLIQEAGLMGACVGGAEVSTKHAGFVINKGDATCCDILQLEELVRKTVAEKFGVELEREVRFVGRR